jgi:hypothetical protein
MVLVWHNIPVILYFFAMRDRTSWLFVATAGVIVGPYDPGRFQRAAFAAAGFGRGASARGDCFGGMFLAHLPHAVG